MKAIVTSLGMIVFAAAIVAGGTGAFFSDTETSTANVFTAGAIDLTVDSQQHYNGKECIPNTNTETAQATPFVWGPGSSVWPVSGTACDGTWVATNLGAQKFWNFSDVKPGDQGENTISLHIDSNPAWACVDVNLTKNDDVSSNEPELATGDATNTADLFDGELAQNLNFAAWADDGDNIWEVGEPLLFSNQSGPASDVLGGKTYALADITTPGGLPLPGGTTSYIGLAWCAGTQAIVGNTITCDGSTLGNIVQTDSLEASVAFRVVQARNNANFTCVAPIN